MQWITRARPKIDRIAAGHELPRHGMVMYDALCARCACTPLKEITRMFGLQPA